VARGGKNRKQGNPAKRSAPKLRVPQEDIDGLNRAFYKNDPTDYFDRRLRIFMEQLCMTDAEARESQIPLTYKSIESTPDSIEESPPDEDAREGFLIVESASILHHVSETLVRAYLAHAANSDCPWLDQAELRAGRAFKQRVAKLAKSLANGAEDEQIRLVFFGAKDLTQTPISVKNSDEVIERLADYLGFAADELLSQANAYNAVKHGMVVSAGTSSFSVSGIPELSGDGPGISALERKVDGDVASVVIAQRWVNLELNHVMSFILTRMIRHIWSVGRCLQFGGSPELKDLYLPPVSSLELRGKVGGASVSPFEMLGISFPPSAYDPPWAGPNPVGARRSGSPDASA
jgi:hypothetical protein